MAASATWDAAFGDVAVEKGAELGFKTDKRRIDELSARDHDDVERRTGFVLTKQLAHSALGPISHHGAADLPSCRDAEPRRHALGSLEEYHHVTAADLEAVLIGPFEIRPASDVLGRAKSLTHALPWPRQAITPRPIPSTAFGLWPADVSKRAGRSWSPSAPGSRACACGAVY